MKSNMSKHFKTKSALRAYADGGDIISRGNQHMDDAIEAMSQGNEAPTMQQTIQAHPVGNGGPFPTDQTPMLDRIFQTAIALGMRSGGPVKGPGGPTDDKIPAMLSHGEYVLPADTVKAVGKGNLDALREKTHEFVGPRPGMANGGDGDVFGQFSQQIGDQPRYQAQDTGAQRLNNLYDEALGNVSDAIPNSRARANSFASNASAAGDVLTAGIEDPAAAAQQQLMMAHAGRAAAGGGLRSYLDQTAGIQPLIPPPNNGRLPAYADGGEALYCEEPAAIPSQNWSGSSKLRFMADGGELQYPQGWSGDPRLRFMANGGTIYPGLEGMEVNEIPTQTLETPPPRYPGAEGISVRQEGLPEPDLPNYRTPNGFQGSETPTNPSFRPTAAAPEAAGAAEAGGEAAAGGLRGLASKALGIPGRVAGAAGRFLGAAAVPLAGAYGAYEGAQGGADDVAARIGQVPATSNQGQTAQRVGAGAAGALSTITAGAFSPQDLANAAQGKDFNPARDQQGWLTRGITDLTGANDRPQPLFNPSTNDVQATGGLRSKSVPTGQPSAAGASPSPAAAFSSDTPGTAVINGRIVSPDEIAQLANRNVVPSGSDPLMLGGGALGTGGQRDSYGRTDGGAGPVFHMPQSDPMDAINSHFDSLSKKIGDIGKSPAKLRALQGIEEARARATEGVFGTRTQGDIERSRMNIQNNQFNRQLGNDAFGRQLDMAKFGVESGRLARQQAVDQARFGLEGAKFRDEQRKDIYTNQAPEMVKSLQGYGVDDKGNLDSKSQQKLAAVHRIIQTSIPSIMGEGKDITDVPKAVLPGLYKAAEQARATNEDQDGASAILKAYLTGGSRAKTENLANAMPATRHRGAIADTVQDAAGRSDFVGSRLRGGGFHPLNAVDLDEAQKFKNLRDQ